MLTSDQSSLSSVPLGTIAFYDPFIPPVPIPIWCAMPLPRGDLFSLFSGWSGGYSSVGSPIERIRNTLLQSMDGSDCQSDIIYRLDKKRMAVLLLDVGGKGPGHENPLHPFPTAWHHHTPAVGRSWPAHSFAPPSSCRLGALLRAAKPAPPTPCLERLPPLAFDPKVTSPGRKLPPPTDRMPNLAMPNLASLLRCPAAFTLFTSPDGGAAVAAVRALGSDRRRLRAGVSVISCEAG